MSKTPVTIELTFAEASEIQVRLETMRQGAVRNVLSRLVRGYIVSAGGKHFRQLPTSASTVEHVR